MTKRLLLFFPVFFWPVFFCAACGTVRPAALGRAFNDDLDGARQLVASARFKQAVEEISLLIDMDPHHEEALLLRGMAYQGLEEFTSAVRDYQAVIEIHPASPKAHYNLGMIFAYKLNDPRRALDHFDRFLASDPNHEKALSVAKVMCALDQGESASEGSGQAMTDLVSGAMSIEDLAQRKKRLREIAGLHPTSPVPLFLIGHIQEEEGKDGEAIRSYEESIAVRPTCAPCHHSLGRLLAFKKRDREAKEHLLKAKLFDPQGSQTDFALQGLK